MKCRVCVSLQNICRLRFTLMSVASSLTPLCKDDLLQASCSEWRDRKAKAHVRTDTHKHKHKAKRKHKQRSKHKHDHKHNTHTTHERAQATSDKHTVAGVRASTCINIPGRSQVCQVYYPHIQEELAQAHGARCLVFVSVRNHRGLRSVVAE